jgi:hypothetical protein
MSLRKASASLVSRSSVGFTPTGGGAAVTISNVIVTDSNWNNLDDTAVGTSSSYIKIIGSGFVVNPSVYVGTTQVSSGNITFVSSTELRVILPSLSLGTQNLFVFNTDYSGAIWSAGLVVSGFPDFTQTTYTSSTPLSVSVQLVATGDAPLTYVLQGGSSLPAGTTLSSSGLITGTTTDGTYQFTVIVSDAQNQSFQQQLTLTVTSTDEYFNRTVLAINGDVNTFVRDASTNSFPVTINGDTKPSAFSPYNTNWSNEFDGTGDQLDFAANSAFTMGAGDFTMELWYYLRASYSAGNAYLFDLGNNGTRFQLYNNQIYFTPVAGSGIVGSAGVGMTINTWYHLAVVRSGSTVTLYLNGTSIGTNTNSNNLTDSDCRIGEWGGGSGYSLNGYISNFRIVKGTAVYTSAFTPPTSQLTAISGTSLLTCQSNRFIDNSTNAFTVTKTGDVKVTAFGPFTETDAMTGSGYFDGTGDYLTIPDSESFDLPGDFTVEFFAYATGGSARRFFQLGNQNSGQNGLLIYSSLANLIIVYVNGAAAITGPTLVPYQWVHIACVRQGAGANNLKLYVNGSLAAQATNTTSFTGVAANGISLGAEYSPFLATLETYISDFRLVKGTAVYTANFTTPVAPLTAVSGTQLLTLQTRQPVNNHTFIDESALRNNVTRNGNPSMGSFSPFSPAGWSNYFDGNGDYLSIPTTNSLMHQIGDWTYEGWIYWNSMPTTGYQNIFGQGAGGQSSFGLTAYNGSSWSAPYKFVVNQANVGNRITGTTTLVAGSWYHFAVVRNSGVITLYVNGTAEGTYSNSTNYDFGGNVFTIGNNSNGYISNFRFNRSAVYTSNFTPPTTALTTVANTSLLTCQSNRFIDNSTNNFSITRNGDTRVTNFSPFKPTTQYSLATHGGSAYFDGSDYLQTNSTDSGLITTGPFTIEVWIYPLSLNTSILTRFYWQTGDNGGWTLSTNSSGFIAFGYSNGVWNSTGGLTATSNPIKINEWSHIAITRDSSNTLRIFVNGLSSVTPITLAQSLDTVAVQQAAVQPRTFRVGVSGLGDGALSSYYTGYISSVKIQTGVAKYTANSTSTLQTFSNESGINYLSNMNTMGIVDITSRNVMETVGNVSLNSTKKYGTGSMYFDGTGDVISLLLSDMLTIGTGDFTVEAWINPGSQPGAYGTIVGAAAAGGMVLTLRGAGTSSGIGLNPYGSGDIFNYSYTFTQGTWVHIAVTRSGTSLRIFVNGTQLSSTVTNSTNWGAITRIGAIDSGGSQNFLGYIDDLRITKFARYTANFTAPTSTFLTQ